MNILRDILFVVITFAAAGGLVSLGARIYHQGTLRVPPVIFQKSTVLTDEEKKDEDEEANLYGE